MRKRKLERNEGKTKKLSISLSTVAVEEQLLRETQMVCILQNKNKQEVTGPESPLPFIPLSSVNWKKTEMCSHQKVFRQTLASDHSKRYKRALVPAGKMLKGCHIVGVRKKSGIKYIQFGEKSGSIAN